MRIFEIISTEPYLYALGWALLHSLWQGALIAALLVVTLALLKGRSPNLRYAAACASLALMLVVPVVTAWSMSLLPQTAAEVDEMSLARAEREGVKKPSESSVAGIVEHQLVTPAGKTSALRSKPSAVGFEESLPWLSMLWAAGVLFLSARTLGGLAYTRRLKTRGTHAVAEHLRERLEEIAHRLRVTRPVRLLESTLVEVPTAIGWLRPVILLPASALTGLTPRQLEIILAHELAHVRRHDFLVNLLQSAVETLLFYHPAVWWVSRQVRQEREHACDDMAVKACGDALGYARALAQMERLRRTVPRLTLAASGGGLRGRILRLVEAPQPSRRFSSLVACCVFAAAVLVTVACTQAVLSRNQNTAHASTGETHASNTGDAEQKKTVNFTGRLPAEVAALVAADDTEGEDPEVRRAAIEALGTRAGAVVVMDPKTGRVHAVVNQEWALRRGWIPASTTKMITGLAGMGEKLFDPAERVRVSDRNERIDFTDALALSNNPYFKSLSERVGSESILNYARRLGLGEATGINYEGETAGRVPASARGANAVRLGTHGDGMEVTPVQLAALLSAIANGGTLVVPRVPRTAEEAARFEAQVRRRIDIPRETLERLIPGLVAAVERGSGSGAKNAPVKVAGKTGTHVGNGSGHGIFASYAPVNDPRLVVVVFTQGKGENGPGASAIAASIYKSLASRL